MENERFDEITRALTSGASRRNTIKALFGGAAASLLAAATLADADARRKKGKKARKGKRGKKKRPIHGPGASPNPGGPGGNPGAGGPPGGTPNDKPDDKQCIANGETCPGGKAERCCSKHVCKNGKCGFPDGTPCKSADECCSKEMCHGKCGKCPPKEPQCLAVTETEGGVEREGKNEWTLTTEAELGYGAIAFGVPNGTTFGDIATIESDFDFETGTCGAGTPRFCVILKDKPECPCTQFPPSSGCNVAGAEGNTGDLTDPTDEWFNLCISNAPVINTYADALALYADEEIDYIFLVAEPSNGPQTVTVEPCITLAEEQD